MPGAALAWRVSADMMDIENGRNRVLVISVIYGVFVANIRIQFETLECCRDEGLTIHHTTHLESQSTRSFFHLTFNIHLLFTVILGIFTIRENFQEHTTSKVTYEDNLTNL